MLRSKVPADPTAGRALEHVRCGSGTGGPGLGPEMARETTLHHPHKDFQSPRASDRAAPARSGVLDLDLDVDAGGQVETLQ